MPCASVSACPNGNNEKANNRVHGCPFSQSRKFMKQEAIIVKKKSEG